MSLVTIERRDAVLICHLDDGKANALSFAMIDEINAVLDTAEHDEGIAALVVHGRPGRFSAGFDLDVMRGGDLAAVVDLVSSGGELVRRMYGGPVPVVAACTGHALAAGALVLLACDLRLGADVDCKIGLNEVAIGMVLPAWALTMAGERLSRRHLQRAVALAEITSAGGARDAGFLDHVVSPDRLLDEAVAAATALGALHRGAYRGTVTALRGATLETMATQIATDRAALRSV